MRKYLRYLPLLVLVSCQLFDKPEKVPGYIKVDGYSFSSNYVSQGTSSSNYKDCWVYINDDLQGVYEMPFEVPILETGDVKLTIIPGIILNGIAETRDIYPFINRYETNITIVPDSTITISPVFSYAENLNFWIEDFEDPSVKIQKASNSEIGFSIADSTFDDNVFERKYCGKVELNETDNYFRAVTNQIQNLPIGKEVYLELDYLNTNSMLIGVVVATSGGESYYPFISLNPSDEAVKGNWKKVYLQLKDNISAFPNAPYFRIFFEAQLEEGRSNTEIYIDNVKIVSPNS